MAQQNKKGGFEFNGGFSTGTGGAGSNNDDLVISNSFGKMGIKSAAADDEEEEEDNEAMTTLPRAVLKRVLALRNMHSAAEELEKEYKLERIALEQKYLAKREVQYAARDKVISGEVEPEVDTTELGDAPADESPDDAKIKGVPEFWSQCLLQHPSTGEIIHEEDMPLLEKLTNITCTYDETYTSFTLHFHFADNEFFTNKVLTKKYGVSPDLLDDKSPALTLNEGTEIDWKPSKNLCVTEIKKKQKAKSGKHKGQVRTVVTTEPKPSFFHYFGQPKPDDEEEEEEEEEDDGIQLSTEQDYDIGHSIRTAIIPEAIMWYTGEADDGEDDDDEDDEEDDEEGDEDEEDEEDEDDSEEDEAPKKGANKKGGKGPNKGGFAAPGAAPAPGAAGEQPECKQN